MCNIRVRERHFGASRLRVTPRAKTLAPSARPLGRDGSFSGLDAPHPWASLPFERFALSSGRYAPSGPAAQARLPGSPDDAGRIAGKPHLAALGWGDPGSRASLGGRGVAPQRPPGPWAAPAHGAGLAPAGWTPAPLRGRVTWAGRRPPPGPRAWGARVGEAGRLAPRLRRPPKKHSPHGSQKTGAKRPIEERCPARWPGFCPLTLAHHR